MFDGEIVREFMFDTRAGVYGYCKCSRPGYDRSHPDNCRWCYKPYREIYLEWSRRGAIKSHSQVQLEEIKRFSEESRKKFKEETGFDDEFAWLESLVDPRPGCECGVCHRKLPLSQTELVEVKSHYPKKRVMMEDCEYYEYPDYYTIERQSGYKVVGYET